MCCSVQQNLLLSLIILVFFCVDVNSFYTGFTCLPGQMLGGYGEFLYQIGMIDELQKQYVNKQTDVGVELIQQQKWVEAFQVRHVWCLLHF